MFDRCVAIFLLFLPLQFALNPSEGVDLPVARIVAIGLFFWWLARSLGSGAVALPRPTILFFWSGFLGITLLSVFWGEEPSFTLRKWAFLASFFPLLFVFSDVLSRKGVSFLLKPTVFGAALVGTLALFQFFAQFFFSADRVFRVLVEEVYPIWLGESFARSVAEHPSLFVEILGQPVLRAVGLFPDPHIAALFFGITGFLSLGLFFSEKKKSFLLVASILFVSVLCSFSRGAYLALLFGGAVFFFLTRRNFFQSGFFSKKTIVAIALFSILVFGNELVRERFFAAFSLEEGSNAARIGIWKEAIEIISEHPFFGVGLGNYPLSVFPAASYRDPFYAHNLYLDIWAEVGVIGLVLFLGLFFFRISSEMPKNFLFPGIVSAAIVFLVHSLVDSALFSVHILPILLLLIAAKESHSQLLCKKPS